MRLFVAIELDEQIRAALAHAQAALRPSCDGVRWVAPQNLHLTVKFLGEVPDREVTGVTEAVARAAADAVPFDMQIAECGCFPPRDMVRIVWAGAVDTPGALLRCVEGVEKRLEDVGYPRERKRFSPHITIGRVREDRSGGCVRSAVEGHALDRLEQSVSTLTLMSSVLSPKGPTYTPVSKPKLGPAGQ